MNAKEVADRLACDVERVAEHLLPNGKRAGAEWCCGSVTGETGDSLRVRLTGSKAGLWKDFAHAGRGGDLLDLWRAARGISLGDAITEAKDWLGVREPRLGPAPQYLTPVKPKLGKSNGAVMTWLTDTRRLSPAAIAAYHVAANQPNTHVVFQFFRDGVLINYKMRAIGNKRDMHTFRGAAPCLFGWQAISGDARTVVICEGELDALALWDYGFPSLSVFSGTKKLAWVDIEYPHLERFSEIFLCFDGDEAGKEGTQLLLERLGPERCKVVTLPRKDANDCLIAGVSREEVAHCFAQAELRDPKFLRCASTFTDEVVREFYPPDEAALGVFLPWPTVGRKVMLRPSELSIWTGINGHGKSQMLGQVMLHAAEQGERALIASLEIKPRKTLYRMTRQFLASAEPQLEEVRRAMSWLGDRVWVFDITGTSKADQLLSAIRYARKRYGVTQIVIDSLMKCGIAEDDYNAQKAFVEALCDFKNDAEVHIHLVAHARKGQDESQAPGKLDVKGAGAITDLADNVFSVWRNKGKENGKNGADAPDAVLFVEKQRNGEWEDSTYLWFDRPSMQFVDSPATRPQPLMLEHRISLRYPAAGDEEEADA